MNDSKSKLNYYSKTEKIFEQKKISTFDFDRKSRFPC